MKSVLLFPFKIVGKIFAWFRRQSRKHKFFIVVLLIVILFFVVRWGAKSNTPEYLTERPMRETITETVTETGNVVTSARVDVYSTATGVVEELYVLNGTSVSAGDPLFTIRSTATQQEKTTAYSNYLAAKTALDTAKATQLTLQASLFDEWDQFKSLAEDDKYEDGSGNPKNDNRTLPEFQIKEKEWLAAEATYKNQAQKIAQGQAATSAAWEAYQATQDAKIVAPIAGRVYNLSALETDGVLAKNEPGATPLLVLANLSYTRIKVELNEVDIPKVAISQNALVKIDALSGKAYKGTVFLVDEIGQMTQGVVTYNVYITLPEADTTIRPGMTVTVEIEVAKKENVLTVSSSAVKLHEGGRAVQVVDPETKKPTFVPVEVGVRGDGRTEILSGIDENTEIITALTNDQVERSTAGPFGQ